MSESVDTITVDCASTQEIKTVNDTPACLPNCEASDVITDVNEVDLNDDDGTSSICTDSSVSDSVNAACEAHNSEPRVLENVDLAPSHVTYSDIHIENSTDILFGTKAIFNEPVIIQQVHQLIVTGDGQVVNHNQQHLQNNEITENQIKSEKIDKSKCYRSIPITISSVSLMGVIVVVGYFLYVQITALHAGAIFVCKTNGTDTCYIGSSTFSCSNLVSSDDRPYISGHTTVDVCNIFAERNCLGEKQEIGTNHTNFNFKALSASCSKKLF